MCGIAGLWDISGQLGDDLDPTVKRMADSMVHRGPDDEGVWIDSESRVGLSHRRLSIIDLSPLGHQPMTSACGRYVIVFNGEIYNFRSLRSELEDRGFCFRGHSDTEIMLSAISHLGLDPALKRFNGMFAFALWDKQERCLSLARDRLGEKPLYYGTGRGVLMFASELKALHQVRTFQPEIDRDVLTLYARHNYVPGPYSIYRGVQKLPPGTYVQITQKSFDRGGPLNAAPIAYWSARHAIETSRRNPFRGSIMDAEEEANRLLQDAVKLRMEADVPLGAFLSGGVDSSTIVALMQAQSSKPIRTFTIGFNEQAFDEAEKASSVARHLGTQHTEQIVTAKETRDVIPLLPRIYDEPFADASQIPTFLVSKLARTQVTVSLSGDGGDELFGGYNRYFWGRSLWRWFGRLPIGLRDRMAAGIEAVPPSTWDTLFRVMSRILPRSARQPNPGHKLHKIASILGASTPEDMYLRLVGYWNAENLVLSGTSPVTGHSNIQDWPELPEFFERMMFVDTVTYLPDDILVKLDRASMAMSLESRVPLLDHRVLEFAWGLPSELRVRGTQGKFLLKQVLERYVPKALVDAPKMGFGIPVGAWIRRELREWAEDLLSERRLVEQGLFDAKIVRRRWHEHVVGLRNWQDDLWGILMFQAWIDGTHPAVSGPAS